MFKRLLRFISRKRLKKKGINPKDLRYLVKYTRFQEENPRSDYYALACYNPFKIGNALYPCGMCAKCKAMIEVNKIDKQR